MAAILWKFKLFDVALIWLQIRNLRPRISGIGLFWTLCIHFWRLFITCQNFAEICKYVRLTVCLFVCYLPKFRRNLQVCSSDGLFVCLFVCNVNDTGRTVQAINTKLGTCMYLGSGYGCIVFGVHDVIDDVIRSKNRSNFEIAITPSIFELECRTKSQKIGNGMAYRGVGLNFRYNFRFKRSPWPQNGGHFENFEIFKIGSFWY